MVNRFRVAGGAACRLCRAWGVSAAWTNAVDATLGGAPMLMADLAPAVSNSGEAEAGARWFLSFVADWLKSNGQAYGPLDAFDFAIRDAEALERIWDGFRLVAHELDASLADVAAFMVKRLPTVWAREGELSSAGPVTVAVQLADRIDTLVSLFHAGEAPTGSKDPFALRRASLAIWAGIAPLTPADFGLTQRTAL